MLKAVIARTHKIMGSISTGSIDFTTLCKVNTGSGNTVNVKVNVEY